MKITVLGYYGGYPFNGDGTSSYLVQSDDFNLLLDCGSGALIELEKHLDPLQLDAVVLTHYHADHIADVGVLQHYWQLAPGIKKKPILPIYGHSFDQPNFDRLNWPNSTAAHSYNVNQNLTLGPLELSFFEVKHPVRTFAVRIIDRPSGKNFVFTADTTTIEGLASFAKKTNLLITDTNFLEVPSGPKWHLTAAESGQLASDAKVDSLLLSHLPQHIEKSKLIDAAKQNMGSIKISVAQKGLVINL